jgi:NAD(P)-dependent dehydrogenase (short-subunit alcohol dehydrogenase family)
MPIHRREFLQLGAAGLSGATLTACAGDEHRIEIDTALPNSPYGAESTAEEVTEGLDLSGQVILITGCTSGLGYESMRVLAKRGAHVIGTGRTLAKAEQACASVEGRTTPVALELSDFQSAVDCAAEVVEAGLVPDVLILNAGINTFGELELVGGIELIFRVNFLGHFVLVNQLLPSMQARGRARIVHVGSRSGYRQAPTEGIDFDNLRGEKAFDSGEAYGRSKLANALFAFELARRLRGSGLTSNVIHPGLVKTNIARTAPTLIRGVWDMFGGLIAKTPEQGAATQVFVATSPTLAAVSGAYFEDCNPVIVHGPHHMYDTEMAGRLWFTAESMTSQFLV